MNTNKPSFIDQPARQFLVSTGVARLIIGAQALAMNACAFSSASLFADILGGLKPSSGAPSPEHGAKEPAQATNVGAEHESSGLSQTESRSKSSDITADTPNSSPKKAPRAASTHRRTAKT